MVIKGNYLFASIGERGYGMIAQDPTKHPGSIIRIKLMAKFQLIILNIKKTLTGYLKYIKLA